MSAAMRKAGQYTAWKARMSLPKVIQAQSITVTPSGMAKKCHCKQLNFTIRLEIGKSQECHCNQMALYCVTVTSVTVSNFSCNQVSHGSGLKYLSLLSLELLSMAWNSLS